VAVITGRPTDRAGCGVLLPGGARLALADVNDEGLRKTLALVEKEKGKGIIKKTDVSREAEVKEMIEQALAYSQIDILCNNAGIIGVG
jgi:NAD(P)-dependent dehydrogenase (short-subunit alcohol dehydrogenase family)